MSTSGTPKRALRACLVVTVAMVAMVAMVFTTGMAGGCRQKQSQPPSATEAQKASPKIAPKKLPTFDLWYRILADGQPIGYRHVTLIAPKPRPGAAPELVLKSEQQTRIVAGGKRSKRSLRLTERCSTTGGLLQLSTDRTTPKGRTRRRYDLRGQTLTVTDPASGSARQTTLAPGAPVTGLCGLYLALLQGADTRTLRSLDPSTGELVTGHVLRRPGSRDTYRYSESNRPGVRTDLVLGPSRLPVRQTVHGLGLTLRLTLSSRAEAQAILAAKPSKPAQSAAIAIDLGARIPEPLEARRIRFALTLARPLPPAVLAELGRANQRRLPGTDKMHLVIDVRRAGPMPMEAAAMPYPLPATTLRPVAAHITHPAPAFTARDARRAQLATLLKGERTALRAALRLTAWASIVRTTGFADRASLLVAALRSARIPARLAFGFLYVGSVMTEHSWAEAYLGRWIALDPETGGAAGATHLRLTVSAADPRRAPDADWRLARPELRGLRARLVEAELASGFRFVPGAQGNAHQVANVLYHRVWNLVVRRPLTARYVLGGARDPFELAVVSTDATLRLELRLFAASPGGLDTRAFLSMGYRPRKIGLRDYLVKDLKPKSPPTKDKGNASGKSLRRSYLQLACSSKPWGARLVRWTLTAKGAKPTNITALENKTLSTFQMTGHPAGIRGCTGRKPAK